MNSYGDPSSSRGRAQPPGANGDPGTGDAHRRSGDASGNGWSARGHGTGRPCLGRAPGGRGGRASVGGSASVPPRAAASPAPPRSAPPRSGARARAGPRSGPAGPRAGGGRPRGPGLGARLAGARWRPGRAGLGRRRLRRAASVGSAAVGGLAGRATVGRAGVAPVSGGAGGPGGPGGPVGRAAVVAAVGVRPTEAIARAKKRQRVNMLIAGFAVFIMLAGARRRRRSPTTRPTSCCPSSCRCRCPPPCTPRTTRRSWPSSAREPHARQDQRDPAVRAGRGAAAEDRNFYQHTGVDFKGIARAAWNNFTGGDKQGASTITQQYARLASRPEGRHATRASSRGRPGLEARATSTPRTRSWSST